MHYKSSYKSQRPRRAILAAFSLVEVLVAIAVIGVIAAIAVPSIGAINSASKAAAARRSAQNMTSVFNSGVAAGVPNFVNCTTVREAAAALNTGGMASTGPFTGTIFRCQVLQNLNDATIPNSQQILGYLSWDNGNLYYDSAGGHVN
jgi:type IV pilus assembly protein PilA